jgi:outer membrane protein assembly factor BamB
MPFDEVDLPPARKPLRLWPGVVAAGLLLIVRFGVPLVVPDAGILGVIGAIAAAAIIIVWWLFFSRAPWSERVGAILVMTVAVFATLRLVHPSISNGMMGMMLPVYSIPALTFALVVAVAATSQRSSGQRRAAMVVAIVLASGFFTLIRTGGISGDAVSDFHWRWTPTPEERLLAHAASEPLIPSPVAGRPDDRPKPAGTESAGPVPAPENVGNPAPAGAEPPARSIDPEGPKAEGEPLAASEPSIRGSTRAEWPGFRGPGRDDVVRGVQIATDWSQSPPVELWRRPIGPGWSSFSVSGDVLYTQEQRGEDEIVSAYSLTSGKPVWQHRDHVRFWESNGGAGPRATPTVGSGRIYSHGATGIVNALNARDGSVVWSRNIAADTDVEVPGWGFASSPLIVGDIVVVAASGRLAAYDIATGRPRWFGPTGGSGYSSPHLVTIDGVPQILLLRGSRTISVAPADGALLWDHTGEPGVGIVQPAFTAEGDVLIAGGDSMGGTGIRRVAVTHGPAGWQVAERWASRGLKPYFSDLVVHKGHAFGFDGSILSCIDLADGSRKWKGGRYGSGQLVLLPDQDLLLVLSEEGELALVRATTDQFSEVARFPALDSKTWNHPVLVGDILLVRNGEEMAAFRLPVTDR